MELREVSFVADLEVTLDSKLLLTFCQSPTVRLLLFASLPAPVLAPTLFPLPFFFLFLSITFFFLSFLVFFREN